MPFLHALTDYHQISQKNVEKLCTYGNYSNMQKFENPRWRRPPSWIYQNHVQRASAKHSVKGGLAFLWEMRFFDPTQLSHK